METDLFHDGEKAGAAFYVTTEELRLIFGVSKMAISNFIKAGMPKHSHNKFDLAISVQWRVNEVMKKTKPTANSETDERRALIVAQTARQRLETAKLRADLIERATVERIFHEFGSIVASSLDSIGPRLAQQVAAMTNTTEIAELLTHEHRSIRIPIASKLRGLAAGYRPVGDDSGDRGAATQPDGGPVGGELQDPAA